MILFWRHILLVVWNCLILCQITVICGKCWFSSTIRRKRRLKAHQELQKVYGDTALSETTCRDWFCLFKDGNFDVDDRPREGRPKTFEGADVIYYKPLKPNETITGERYRTQLMRLSRALRKKRAQYEQRDEKVILQHDNAHPHVAKPV